MGPFRMVSAAVAFAGLSCATAAVAQLESPDSFVLTERDAVGLLPPVLVAGPNVMSATWSSDGRYVLAQRISYRISPAVVQSLYAHGDTPGSAPPGDTVLTVWDAVTQQSRDVWKQPLDLGRIQIVQWLPRSSIAFAIVAIREAPKDGQPAVVRRVVLRINAEAETSKVIAEPAEFFELSVSPTDPVALLSMPQVPIVAGAKTARDFKGILRTIRESGTPGKEIEIAPPLFLSGVVWGQDGGAILRCAETLADTGGTVTRLFSLDPYSGKLKPMEKQPPAFHPVPATTDLTLKEARVAATEGATTRTLAVLWLEGASASEQPRAMVATNTRGAELSPRREAVLYISDGAAWVRPLVRLPKDAYAAVRDKARVLAAMHNAKQLVTGLLMYSADSNGTLPNADGINAKLEPYLKSDSVFEGFAYTYGGGSLAGIDNPSQTEVGYVSGPGGRAIMYADGHVTWKQD